MTEETGFLWERLSGTVTAPRPAQMTADQIRETLVSPEAADAMRADIERAIDDAAKGGKALQVPIGKDAEDNAVMG